MVKLVNIKLMQSDSHRVDSTKKATEQAKKFNWEWYINDTPCVKELKDFADALSEVMPTVKFHPLGAKYDHIKVKDDQGNYATTESIAIFEEYAVYLDEYPFDIGRINFKDNAARKNSAATYGVYSRKIRNAKYAAHRDQFHMVTASDVKKAVKSASKYLVPYSTKELAQAFYDKIVGKVTAEAEKPLIAIQKEMRELTQDRMGILRELAYLKESGVKFKSADIDALASRAKDLVDTADHEANRAVGAIYVRIYRMGEETFFSTQQAIELKKHYNMMQGSEEGKIEGKPVAEMPQDISGAVAVLSILDNMQYVPTVGMKLDGENFWIERG